MRGSGQLATLLVLGLALCAPRVVARDSESDPWTGRRVLVERLGAQGERIAALAGEVERLEEVLGEVDDIVLFPSEVTGFTDRTLAAVDRELERVRKLNRILIGEIAALRPPLAEAVGIVREMVTTQEVPQMFDVIERGVLERIGSMLTIRGHIRATWAEMEGLLEELYRGAAVTMLDTAATVPADNREFMEILRANLGLQHRDFLARLSLLKDSLVLRASPAQARGMLRLEMLRVRRTLEQGQVDHTLRERLVALRRRYSGKSAVVEVDIALLRADFMLGRYQQVVDRAGQLPEGAAFEAEQVRFTAQSLYKMGEMQRLHDFVRTVEPGIVGSGLRNLLLWLTIESGIRLGIDDDFSRLATQVERDSVYALHVLYAFAQSYVSRGEWDNAQAVLDGALRIRTRNERDVAVRNRVRISRAHIEYEKGNYARSRDLYFELLNEGNTFFEEALFGIIWSYIGLGDFSRAEVSLVKLINQSPHDPLAVESILLMAKRQLARARLEWEKLRTREAERRRLEELHGQLTHRVRHTVDSATVRALRTARAEVRTLIEKSDASPGEGEAGIRRRFERASRIAELVRNLYASGLFQERALSGEREQLLYRLDSLAQTFSRPSGGGARDGGFTQQRRSIERIRELVHESTVLQTRILLERYRWEGENLDRHKNLVLAAQDSVRAALGSNADGGERERVLAPLRQRLDSLVEATHLLDEHWFSRLSRRCYDHLSGPLSEDDEVFVRYQLGELLYARENARYVEAFTRYEYEQVRYDSLMKQFRDGRLVALPLEPREPRLDHTGSMSQFAAALRAYPRNPYAPALLYSLAWCYSDINRSDSAVALMEQLAQGWPSHEYAPQAWMYIGEHHFDNNRLDDALAAYQRVMQHPESKWFDDALYKFAWTHYRLSNPEKAISSFLALVDLGGRAEAGKAVLAKESMDYIAISFSESDMTGRRGLERATQFVKRLGDDEKGTQILFELGRVYRDQGRYDMASQAWHTLLDLFPAWHSNWIVESRLLALRERDLSPAQHDERKVAYFRTYTHTSPWAAGLADTTMRQRADSAAAEALYLAGISRHQQALQHNRAQLYEEAAQTYELFIRHYPLAPRTNEVHYNFAEITFSLGDYARAAEEYMAVSKRYPDSKYRETAAWNAIVASQNLLRREQEGK